MVLAVLDFGSIKYFPIEDYWDTLEEIYLLPQVKTGTLREMNSWLNLKYDAAVVPLSDRIFPEHWQPIHDYDSAGLIYAVSWKPCYISICCYGACFFTANINLAVLRIAFPEASWQIIHNSSHAVVYSLKYNLAFDPVFQAIAVPAIRVYEQFAVNGYQERSTWLEPPLRIGNLPIKNLPVWEAVD